MSSEQAAPPWLAAAISGLQEHYPDDRFEAILRRPGPRAPLEWRMKCLDCPGKVRPWHAHSRWGLIGFAAI